MADHPPVTVEQLVWAYTQGIFPMADTRDGPTHWYRPDVRAIMPLDTFHVSRSLAKRVRQRVYRISSDLAFDRVMQLCAAPSPDRPETWINDEIIDLYGQLHRLGLAHSIEAWAGDELVGGLYGVAVGAAFFGESMFSRRTDASKVCLVRLVEHLRARGYELLDVQFTNPHLKQFGVVELAVDDYLAKLNAAIERSVSW